LPVLDYFINDEDEDDEIYIDEFEKLAQEQGSVKYIQLINLIYPT